ASGGADRAASPFNQEEKDGNKAPLDPPRGAYRACLTGDAMLWRFPRLPGGPAIAIGAIAESAPGHRRRGGGERRRLRPTGFGHLLRAALGVSLQHPYRRMAPH